MNRPERKVDLYVKDIITAMERILQYIDGHDLESFQNNFMVSDAVVRNFEITGEAVKRIPKDLRDMNTSKLILKHFGR